MADAVRSLGAHATVAGSVAEALEVALGEAGPDELVLVTGSLYVVGAARALLMGAPGLEPAPASTELAQPSRSSPIGPGQLVQPWVSRMGQAGPLAGPANLAPW